jgi:predicted aspartyl protease
MVLLGAHEPIWRDWKRHASIYSCIWGGRMTLRAILVTAAFAFAIWTPALAEDCAPLKLLSSIKMTPIDGKPGEVRTVPVDINDQTKTFLLDTGGALSQISRKTADELKMDIQDSGSFQLYDANGNMSRKLTTAEKFRVGRMLFTKVRLPISTFGGDGIDGILSSNMLVNYDIDLDFPDNTMNYVSPDHCKGNVLYWKADAVGVVPVTLVDNTRISVKVTLEGQTFDAFIDTGATHSVMSDQVAKYFFHVPLAAPGDKPIEKINGDPTLTGYLHTFSKLSFGGVEIDNPQIMILEDRMNRGGDRSQQTANRAYSNNAGITLPKLVIGMNMLNDLHVYMSFAERRLYVTRGTATAATSATP